MLPFFRAIRPAIALVLCLSMVCSPCSALVSLNDGRDKLYLTATTSMGWDSNIYARQGGSGDFTTNLGLSSEYTRRAGVIGVDASVAINTTRFNKFSEENFSDPDFNIEFTKESGRTTGSLTFAAARENRADAAANLRTQSWYYASGLNLKYPVIGRYTLSGGIGWTYRDFQNDPSLVDLKSYTANIDVFYVYNTERDIFGGYRYRKDDTSSDTESIDHSFTLGISGKILPKLHGSVRAGYQVRNTQYMLRNQAMQAQATASSNYRSWTASSALTWNVSKRFTINGLFSKDFSTTSTDMSDDMMMANIDANYTFSPKLSIQAGFTVSQSRFLGDIGSGRKDQFFSFNISAGYNLSNHLKAILSETYSNNYSTSSFADFARNSISLSLSSRW